MYFTIDLYAPSAPARARSMARDPSRQPLRRHEEEADRPTTKLWVGGISGDASEETIKRIFGK